MLLLAGVGIAVGVVVSRSSGPSRAVEGAADQPGEAPAAAAGVSEGSFLYSVNVRMVPDSRGNPGPSCGELFGGTSPRTVSGLDGLRFSQPQGV